MVGRHVRIYSLAQRHGKSRIHKTDELSLEKVYRCLVCVSLYLCSAASAGNQICGVDAGTEVRQECPLGLAREARVWCVE